MEVLPSPNCQNQLCIFCAVERSLKLTERGEHPTVSLTENCINGDILEFYIQTPSATFLKNEVGFADDVIDVESTYGFPESNGILKIDSEIILYKSKTDTSFVDCTRGFSGITSYRSENNTDQLI